jgi:hypothetical protein
MRSELLGRGPSMRDLNKKEEKGLACALNVIRTLNLQFENTEQTNQSRRRILQRKGTRCTWTRSSA